MEKQNISSERQNPLEKWGGIVHIGSIIITGALAHSTYLAERIIGPISKEGILLTCAVNGAASCLAPKISDAFGIDSEWKKVVITVATFAIVSFATPFIASNLMVGMIGEVSQVFAFTLGMTSLCMRATVFTLYTFSQGRAPEQSKPSKDVATFTPSELAAYKVELEQDDYKKWNDLSFSMQMAFNKKWPDSRSRIPFTKLAETAVISSEDLEVIVSANKESRTEEFAEFLFSNNVPPMQRDYSENELRFLNYALRADEIDDLSDEKVRWYHVAFCSGGKPLNARFGERFYALELSAPSEDFAIQFDVKAIDLSQVKEYQVSWYFHHLNARLGEWKALSLKTQHEFNTHFSSALAKKLPLFPRTQDEIIGADAPLINELEKQYRADFSLWITLSPTLCKELNKKFNVPINLPQNANDIRKLSKKELEMYRLAFEEEQIPKDRFTPDLYQVFQERFLIKGMEVPRNVNLIADNYVPTWKKVAVIGLCICVIVVPLMAIFGLPLVNRNRENQKNESCSSEGCNEEPIVGFNRSHIETCDAFPTIRLDKKISRSISADESSHFYLKVEPKNQVAVYRNPLSNDELDKRISESDLFHLSRNKDVESKTESQVAIYQKPFLHLSLNEDSLDNGIPATPSITPNLMPSIDQLNFLPVGIESNTENQVANNQKSPLQPSLLNTTNYKSIETCEPFPTIRLDKKISERSLHADEISHFYLNVEPKNQVAIYKNPLSSDDLDTRISESALFHLSRNKDVESKTESQVAIYQKPLLQLSPDEDSLSSRISETPSIIGNLMSSSNEPVLDCEVESRPKFTNDYSQKFRTDQLNFLPVGLESKAENQITNHQKRPLQPSETPSINKIALGYEVKNSSEPNNDHSQTYVYGAAGFVGSVALVVFEFVRRKFSYLEFAEEDTNTVIEPESVSHTLPTFSAPILGMTGRGVMQNIILGTPQIIQILFSQVSRFLEENVLKPISSGENKKFIMQLFVDFRMITPRAQAMAKITGSSSIVPSENNIIDQSSVTPLHSDKKAEISGEIHHRVRQPSLGTPSADMARRRGNNVVRDLPNFQVTPVIIPGRPLHSDKRAVIPGEINYRIKQPSLNNLPTDVSGRRENDVVINLPDVEKLQMNMAKTPLNSDERAATPREINYRIKQPSLVTPQAGISRRRENIEGSPLTQENKPEGTQTKEEGKNDEHIPSTLPIPSIVVSAPEEKKVTLVQKKSKSEENPVNDENKDPNIGSGAAPMRESIQAIPLISLDTLKECNSIFISLPEWKGVSLEVSSGKDSSFAWQGMPIKNGNDYEVESKQRALLNEKYVSPLDRFNMSEENSAQIPKDFNPESFVYPKDSIVLHIREKEMGMDQFKEAFTILSEGTHKLDAICLHGNKEIKKSPSWIFGRNIPTKAAIFQIKTLAFRDFSSLKVSLLEKLGKDFPNIACLDLRGTELNDDVNRLEELKKRFILLGPNEESNAEEHLKALNTFLINIVKGCSSENISKFHHLFPKIGINQSPYSFISPAACFVSNLFFLRGLPILDSTFKELINRLPRYFRSVKMLDISKCENLTVASFKLLEKIPLERLAMVDSQHLHSNIDQFKGTLQNLIKKGLIFIDMRFVLGVDKAFERKIRPILQQKPFGVYPQLICSPVGQAKAITWVYNPKKVVK